MRPRRKAAGSRICRGGAEDQDGRDQRQDQQRPQHPATARTQRIMPNGAGDRLRTVLESLNGDRPLSDPALLLEVVKEDPTHGEALVLLAHFYRDQGLKARAAHMLRKVADLFPDNEQVRAELDALTEHEPDGGTGAKGGLLKRLFTRG